MFIVLGNCLCDSHSPNIMLKILVEIRITLLARDGFTSSLKYCIGGLEELFFV